MKWCCIGFEAHYEAAGQRGHAILIGRDSLGRPEVAMQYRAVAIGEELEIKTKSPVSTVVDVRIVFCPWCGRNVEEWYGSNVDSLHREGLRITI
jgi:hypothetical protein